MCIQQKFKGWKIHNKWTVLHGGKHHYPWKWKCVLKIQYYAEFNKDSNHPSLTIKKSQKMMNWQYIIVWGYLHTRKAFGKVRYLYSLILFVLQTIIECSLSTQWWTCNDGCNLAPAYVWHRESTRQMVTVRLFSSPLLGLAGLPIHYRNESK